MGDFFNMRVRQNDYCTMIYVNYEKKSLQNYTLILKL